MKNLEYNNTPSFLAKISLWKQNERKKVRLQQMMIFIAEKNIKRVEYRI